jgi:dTDP-4-amino-4,6-dideoxygalactose transaminase
MVGACQVGTFGDIGILSFNGNKVITTGGGGAIITRDKKIADRARHLSTQAKTKHPYEYIHDQHGFNMRMPALNAALGVSQMDALSWILCRKAQNFYFEYSDVFYGLDLPHIRPSESYSWNCWLVSFNAESRRQRDAYLKAFHRRGIQARPLWAPLNAYGPYVGCESMPTPGADQAYDQIVCLPSGVGG